MRVISSGESLGATIEGLDLSLPLNSNELKKVMDALGAHGVVRFPKQSLSGKQLRDFSAQLGDLEINVASGPYQEQGVPEVMILSNIVENGFDGTVTRTPEEFAAMVRADIVRYAKLVKDAGLQID